MSLGVEFPILPPDLALTGHRAPPVVEDPSRRDDVRRERDGVHEFHAEIDGHDFLVERETGGARRRIRERHEDATVHNAVEVRMLLLDRELEPHTTALCWHDLRVQVFDERVLMVKTDDGLLQVGKFCHAGSPSTTDSTSTPATCQMSGFSWPTGTSFSAAITV